MYDLGTFMNMYYIHKKLIIQLHCRNSNGSLDYKLHKGKLFKPQPIRNFISYIFIEKLVLIGILLL